MSMPKNSPAKLDDLIMFPISQELLFGHFGKAVSIEDRIEREWFRQTFPLIRSTAGLQYVEPVLNLIDEEFCSAFTFDPEFISNTFLMGFFPMATTIHGKPVMLIKMHRQRCVLLFKDLHIPKNVKKRAKHYHLTVDRDFDTCLQQITEQHADNWLYPPLAETFRQMHRTGKHHTKLHSFELWEKDELVAGEIGFAVGACYSSLSGFYNKDSAGTVQMCATARLLQQSGFALWDLGMEMEYKLRLGARNAPIDNFLQFFRKNRHRKTNLPPEKLPVKDLLKEEKGGKPS